MSVKEEAVGTSASWARGRLMTKLTSMSSVKQKLFFVMAKIPFCTG